MSLKHCTVKGLLYGLLLYTIIRTLSDQINQFRYEESPEIALEKDDIIFSKDGALGNPALVKELPKPSTINSTMMLVRLNSKTISPDFSIKYC